MSTARWAQEIVPQFLRSLPKQKGKCMQILGQYAASTYTGTGVALTLTPGFSPCFIFIQNETDGTFQAVWIRGLAAASYYQNNGAGANTLVSSNGITVSASGVTIGTAAGINTNAKVYRYFMV